MVGMFYLRGKRRERIKTNICYFLSSNWIFEEHIFNWV